MSSTENNPAIPPQQTGGSSDTESTTTLDSTPAAKAFFNVVKQRLLHVSDWQKWAGAATAHFQLTDAAGNNVNRSVQEGDYFKIDIPGPGSAAGEGFDWVRVETVNETASDDGQEVAVQVRPSPSPINTNTDVAHFFSSESTSCFVVKQHGNAVTAAVHGRNEKPNTDATTWLDKARNAAVATGAVAAFSKLQWKSLVSGLVKKDA